MDIFYFNLRNDFKKFIVTTPRQQGTQLKSEINLIKNGLLTIKFKML